MAKKKKTALKPLARGFATTSLPKKVEPVVEVVEEEEPQIPVENVPSGDGGAGKQDGDDWDDGEKLEEARLQGYVDRLQEKGDKEVNRIMKSIEFDRRMTKGSIPIELDPKLVTDVLALRRAQPITLNSAGPTPTDQAAKEKNLLKLYVTSQVLTKLGYPEARIVECLEYHCSTGAGAIGWEAATDWMWLHCGDGELRGLMI